MQASPVYRDGRARDAAQLGLNAKGNETTASALVRLHTTGNHFSLVIEAQWQSMEGPQGMETKVRGGIKWLKTAIKAAQEPRKRLTSLVIAASVMIAVAWANSLGGVGLDFQDWPEEIPLIVRPRSEMQASPVYRDGRARDAAQLGLNAKGNEGL